MYCLSHFIRTYVIATVIYFCFFLGNIVSVSAAAINISTIDPTSTVYDSNTSNNATSTAIGLDGFARVSYFADGNLRYLRCTNDSCSTPVITTVATGKGIGPNLSVASDGFARISFRDAGWNINFAQCQDIDCTSVILTAIDNSAGIENATTNTSMILGNDGFARVAFYNGTTHRLSFIQCTNASCSTKTTTTVDNTFSAGRSVALSLGTDGFARIVYQVYDTGQVMFLQCSNADCSTNTKTGIDGGSAPVQMNTALAMGSDGFARIVFNRSPYNNLTYIQCTNDTCSTFGSTLLNPNQPFGGMMYEDLYIKIGSDSLPRITYNSRITGNIEYIICSNQACTTPTFITIANVYRYLSMALTTSDIPRFSYVTGYPLKYAFCTTSTCAAPPVFSMTTTLSSSTPSATDVQQTFAINLSSSIGNGGKASLAFPAAFSTSFATLTDADVSVTGTNIASTTETFDTAQNKLTSTLTTTGATSDLTVTIGDGAPGGLNDLSNPSVEGVYGVGFSTFSSLYTLIEQGLTYLDIGSNFAVHAIVSEALIFTVENTNIVLAVDPSINNGENITQYTVLTGASNALNGYSIYGSLDDGTGNARLSNGSNHITSGTGENSFSFEAKNADYASNEVVEGDNNFANIPTLLTSNSANISVVGPTNSQQHTIYYDLNVDYLTVAGIYTGTIMYTAIGSF